MGNGENFIFLYKKAFKSSVVTCPSVIFSIFNANLNDGLFNPLTIKLKCPRDIPIKEANLA